MNTTIASPPTAVVVRPADASDAARVRDMLTRCSTDTLFHRMLGHSSRAADLLVEPLLRRDPAGRFDVVAVVAEAVVGWACLVPDSPCWDVGLVVEDRWQGRGVGGRLAESLARRARSADVRSVRAVTTPANHRVAALIRRHATILRPAEFAGTEVEYRIGTAPPKGTERP